MRSGKIKTADISVHGVGVLRVERVGILQVGDYVAIGDDGKVRICGPDDVVWGQVMRDGFEIPDGCLYVYEEGPLSSGQRETCKNMIEKYLD